MAIVMPDETTDETARAEQRAARRAFIRSAHPDLGGDPDAFIAGLARYDGPTSVPSDDRPRVHRSRRPDRVVRHAVRGVRRRLSGKPPRNLS